MGVYLPSIVDVSAMYRLADGGHAHCLAPFSDAIPFTSEGLGHGLVGDLERPSDRARGHSKAV